MRDLSLFLTFVLAILFHNSSDFIFKMKSNGVRIATYSFMFTMFILTSGYSASLISFLTITVYPPPADTFSEVANLVKVRQKEPSQ